MSALNIMINSDILFFCCSKTFIKGNAVCQNYCSCCHLDYLSSPILYLIINFPFYSSLLQESTSIYKNLHPSLAKLQIRIFQFASNRNAVF